MPGRQGMPDSIKRSPAKAQRTWQETRDSAMKEYGDGRRAQQTAYAALKHSFEKQGDRWEPKGRKDISDSRGRTFGHVTATQSKEALAQRARGLGVAGWSRMTREELAEAIAARQ